MVFTEAAAGMWEQPLPAAEEQHLAGAVPRRIREFRAGRHSARAGLARIGLRPDLLLPAPGGGVLWPDRHMAARGGFDYSDSYRIFATDPTRWPLKVTALPVEGSERPFDEWRGVRLHH